MNVFYLIGAEEKILGEFRETYSPTAPDFHLQAMVQSAGKLVLIDKLLPKMKAGGHKVLIFSQMVRCLDILEDYLIHKRYDTIHIENNGILSAIKKIMHINFSVGLVHASN